MENRCHVADSVRRYYNKQMYLKPVIASCAEPVWL